MDRRRALAALAWAGAAPLCAPAAQGAWIGAASEGGVLAWGPQACWVGEAGGPLQVLAGEPAPELPPVGAAGAVWRVLRDGALERWQRDAALEWHPAWTGRLPARVHALAASDDGGFALAAHGEQLSLLDAHGGLVKAFEGRDLARTRHGPAQALFALAQRRSFVAGWPALGELWEISLDPAAPPVFEGLVHDYRMSEAIGSSGYLGVRRAPLGLPLPAFGFADARVPWLAGSLGDAVAVVHLDVRRRIATLALPGARPAAATLRREGGAWQWWLPVGDAVQLVDTARWTLLERLPLPGPVQRLQALGDAVWALAGQGEQASLLVRRGGPWQQVAVTPGRPTALAADAGAQRLLVATEAPAAVLLLDAGGGALARWPLPSTARVEGLAWMPAS